MGTLEQNPITSIVINSLYNYLLFDWGIPLGDLFSKHYSHLESPAADAFAITPSDSADLATFTRSIYVGGSGNIKLTTINGSTVTLNGAIAGSIIPIRAKRIFSTGTTATNLIGLL